MDAPPQQEMSMLERLRVQTNAAAAAIGETAMQKEVKIPGLVRGSAESLLVTWEQVKDWSRHNPDPLGQFHGLMAAAGCKPISLVNFARNYSMPWVCPRGQN